MALLLASASPRRRELLSRLGIPFGVSPVGIEEDVRASRPELAARRLARSKAEAARLLEPKSAVIAADTIVWHAGEALGKPRDAIEACEMLRRLRGDTHEVVTAVALLSAGERSALIRHASTRVRMRQYDDAEIEASIARGDPFDKAAAYAIQDRLFDPVESYEGCYCNVVGLPLWSTMELLRRAGFDITHIKQSDLLPQCARCPLRVSGEW